MNRSHFSFTNVFRRSSRQRVPREVVLRSNEHLKLLHPATADAIRCLRGTVWITCDGQRDDIVLTAGHEWQPRHTGAALIGALSDAVLRVDTAAA